MSVPRKSQITVILATLKKVETQNLTKFFYTNPFLANFCLQKDLQSTKK